MAPRLPLLLSLVALWLVLGVSEWIWPCFFLHDDNATQYIAFFNHDYRVLTESGRLAEINYYQYGGEPYLEQGQTAVLYPPVYLAVALAKWVSGDVRWTIEWMVAIHLTLGLIGFYYWLRQGGMTAGYAALGSLAWVFNPFIFILCCSWENIAIVACCLPWIFYMLDRLLIRPGLALALGLGLILGLLFLQGTVQWVAYAILFLGIYVALRLIARMGVRRLLAGYYLFFAALFFLAVILPLLLPMLHAVGNSVSRSHPMVINEALTNSVHRTDLIKAQFLLFRTHMVFGVTSAILFCPAALLFPLMILSFPWVEARIQERLFPLLLLSLAGIIFSSHWHIFLNLLPVFEKFRWPFKVFVFAEFFLVTSLVWWVSSWGKSRAMTGVASSRVGLVFLILVIGANVTVSLACHNGNFLSGNALPSSKSSLPKEVDPRLGRVMAISTGLAEVSNPRYISHCYGTMFAVPSLGGYNPLVGVEQLRFGVGLDFLNSYTHAITPEIRKQLDARSARYWIIDPRGGINPPVESLPGLKLLSSEPDRLVYENLQAAPLVYSDADLATPYPLTYSGNSILIPLDHAISPLEVSVGPTDGWWYRIDRGPWIKPVNQNDRLRIDFQAPAKLLEISYCDPRFRQGLRWSLILFVFLGILISLDFHFRKRKQDLTNN